uniref:Uncharacterized protein n=1 Tax=Aegilops tauschii subsp. strangulata TaxID=200361 RepID=A0A453R3T4_AEGTS
WITSGCCRGGRAGCSTLSPHGSLTIIASIKSFFCVLLPTEIYGSVDCRFK